MAIVLGLGLSSFAQSDGLFRRAYNAKNGTSGYSFFMRDGVNDGNTTNDAPILPSHGQQADQPAPLGSGIAVLLGLGAAYMVAKKRREE